MLNQSQNNLANRNQGKKISLKTEPFDSFQKFPTIEEYPKTTDLKPSYPIKCDLHRKHRKYRETLYSIESK